MFHRTERLPHCEDGSHSQGCHCGARARSSVAKFLWDQNTGKTVSCTQLNHTQTLLKNKLSFFGAPASRTLLYWKCATCSSTTRTESLSKANTALLCCTTQAGHCSQDFIQSSGKKPRNRKSKQQIPCWTLAHLFAENWQFHARPLDLRW